MNITTDDQLRALHRVADTILHTPDSPEAAVTLAKYVHANIPRPKTLSDELRNLAALLEEEGGAGAKSTCWAKDLANLAEQMEKQRDTAVQAWKDYEEEALAAVESRDRARAERDEARALLATRVDASRLDATPTISDEIRAWADKHYTGVVGTGKYELLALADRADELVERALQAETDAARMQRTIRERDEARAEAAAARTKVERLTKDLEDMTTSRDQWEDRLTNTIYSLATIEEVGEWSSSNELHYAFIDHMKGKIQRLQNVVQQLTDALNRRGQELAATTLERDRLAAERTRAPEENVAADLPDPADVPVGEPWIAEVDGSTGQWVGVRNDPEDGGQPWTMIHRECDGPRWVSDARVTLVSRLVPAPRVITNPDDLDKLATRAVIISTDGKADIYQKDGNGEWLDVTGHGYSSQRVLRIEDAVTVLWEPEA